MPEINISAGESYEIVPEQDTDAEHNISHVSGGAVHLSHNPRDVQVNPTEILEPNDRARLGNYRGSAVHAYAPKGATVRVSERGFSVDFLTRAIVERPSDKAVSDDRVETQDASFTDVASGGTADKVISWVNDGKNLRLTQFFGALGDPGFSNDVFFDVRVRDSSGVILNHYYFHTGAFPHTLEPSIRVPEGGDVRVWIENNSASQVDIEFVAQAVYDA